MGIKRALPLPGSIILIFVAVSCTMGALISGFIFQVDPFTLALAWTAAALAIPLSSLLWRGKGLLLLIPLALLMLMGNLTKILNGAMGAICNITYEFNKWLYIPVLFSGHTATSGELTAFFTAAGLLLTGLLFVAICLRRSILLVISLTAPLALLTFVIVYIQPDPVFLIGLLAVYLTLLINNALFPAKTPQQRSGAFAALALAAVILGAAYLAVPPEGYSRSRYIEQIDLFVRELTERTGLTKLRIGTGWPALSSDGVWRFNTSYVAIGNAGARVITDTKVIEVTASQPGVFYLKGYSMQYYDGTGWRKNSADAKHPDEIVAATMPAVISSIYGQIYPSDAPAKITMGISGIRQSDASMGLTFTPYYFTLPVSAAMEYDVDFYYAGSRVVKLAAKIEKELYTDILHDVDHLDSYGEWVRTGKTYSYDSIEKTTAARLRRLASEAGIDAADIWASASTAEINAERERIANQVAGYISSAARYTLNPRLAPEDEDFALYFLTESKQGYCIHFATAATLMLRALDIPARFTSGFVVTVNAASVGKTVNVTDRNAHAWVEVYYENIGWVPLEVTPSSLGGGIQDGRQPASSVTPPEGESAPAPESETPPTPSYSPIQSSIPSAAPSGGQGGANQAKPISDTNKAAIYIICIIAAPLLLVLHRTAVRYFRKRRFHQKDANLAVMCAWRYVMRLLRKRQAPDDIETLALKARFSQHRISEGERTDMMRYTRELAGESYDNSNPFGKLWLKWGIGV